MREPVVFLPDIMCDARLFGPQIAALSRDRAVMMAPVTQGERIEDIAAEVLEVLPERFALAGVGLGGIVALEIARRAPDRVARLALIGTSPLAETPQQAAEREPRIIRVRTGRLGEVVQDELGLKELPPVPHRAEIRQLVMDMAEGQGPDVYARQCRALQRRRDQQITLRKLAMPVMVLCGTQDKVYPVKRHSFMAELIHGAVLRVIDGAGHLPMLEQPEVMADALKDWLSLPLVLRMRN